MNLLVDVLLLVGACLRVTRLVTTDDLGRWWIVDPAEGWAIDREGYDLHDGAPMLDVAAGWRSKLVSGLSCGHCVGVWVTVFLAGLGCLSLLSPTAHTIWEALAGAGTVAYLVGHVNTLID